MTPRRVLNPGDLLFASRREPLRLRATSVGTPTGERNGEQRRQTRGNTRYRRRSPTSSTLPRSQHCKLSRKWSNVSKTSQCLRVNVAPLTHATAILKLVECQHH